MPALKNPIHWVINFRKMFTTAELNTLTDHLTDEATSRALKHGLIHHLMTEPNVGLAPYGTSAFKLNELFNRALDMHARCAAGERPKPDDWGPVYLESERAYGLADKAVRDLRKDKPAQAEANINKCFAEALRNVTYRNNENPVTITGLVDAIATLAGLAAEQRGASAKAAEAATRAELKRNIFEFLTAPAEQALAA